MISRGWADYCRRGGGEKAGRGIKKWGWGVGDAANKRRKRQPHIREVHALARKPGLGCLRQIWGEVDDNQLW